VAWLEQQIFAIKKEDMENGRGRGRRRILFVTHHAPIRHGASRPEYEGTPLSDAFGTELLDIIHNKKKTPSLLDVQWLVFGHTHYITNIVQGTVKLVGNQRGYVLPKPDAEGLVAGAETTMLMRLIQYLSPCFRSHTRHHKHDFDVCRTIRV
jgi:hypothetical protein